MNIPPITKRTNNLILEEIKFTLLIGSTNNEAMVFGYINAKAIDKKTRSKMPSLMI